MVNCQSWLYSVGLSSSCGLSAYFFLPAVRPAPALNLKKMMSPSSTW